MLWRLWLLVVPDRRTNQRTRSPIELFWTAKNDQIIFFGIDISSILRLGRHNKKANPRVTFGFRKVVRKEQPEHIVCYWITAIKISIETSLETSIERSIQISCKKRTTWRNSLLLNNSYWNMIEYSKKVVGLTHLVLNGLDIVSKLRWKHLFFVTLRKKDFQKETL